MTVPTPPSPVANVGAPVTIEFEAVYERLKAMTSRQLGRGLGNTLDTTGLVHEACLKFDAGRGLSFEHSAQFFAYAARAMRHVLIDRASARLSHKAGGEWMRVTFTANAESVAAFDSAEQVIALDEALARLEQAGARAEKVVELRYFAGLSPEQLAEAGDPSHRRSRLALCECVCSRRDRVMSATMVFRRTREVTCSAAISTLCMWSIAICWSQMDSRPPIFPERLSRRLWRCSFREWPAPPMRRFQRRLP